MSESKQILYIVFTFTARTRTMNYFNQGQEKEVIEKFYSRGNHGDRIIVRYGHRFSFINYDEEVFDPNESKLEETGEGLKAKWGDRE